MTTKKDLEIDNNNLKKENLLMVWHIKDLYEKIQPDKTEKIDRLKGMLYRSKFACGGYIVLHDFETNNITIHYLEDIYSYAKNLPSGDSYLPIKIITERLYITRNKILFNS